MNRLLRFVVFIFENRRPLLCTIRWCIQTPQGRHLGVSGCAATPPVIEIVQISLTPLLPNRHPKKGP